MPTTARIQPLYQAWSAAELEEEDQPRRIQRPFKERPTQPVLAVEPEATLPETPKIVVLGASGRVGRLVIKELMAMSDVDMTVVAFVRDLKKANRVLFQDDFVLRRRPGQRPSGPVLEMVVGDLVPPEELPGFYDREEEDDWKRRATSTAKYFGSKRDDYDNRDKVTVNANEALEEAIQGCTTIISCVGSQRLSNWVFDFFPFWRIFNKDASRWCKDPKHPYYVVYQSTRKALELAEAEQRKRNTIIDKTAKEETDDDDLDYEDFEFQFTDDPKKEVTKISDRIRFIRLSDLAVSRKPFYFIPLMLNTFNSMVLRYHEMAERLLQESELVDAIILRVGDFPNDEVENERDTQLAALQVEESGTVPYPALIGREDVASLLAESAMFNASRAVGAEEPSNSTRPFQPFHMTLAARWCGDANGQSQGRRRDGWWNAHKGLKNILPATPKSNRTVGHRLKNVIGQSPSILQKMSQKMTRRKLKPYGVFVGIFVYVVMAIVASNVLSCLPAFENIQIGPWISGRAIPSIKRFSGSIVDVLVAVNTWLDFRMPTMKRWVASIMVKKKKAVVPMGSFTSL